jgi:putative Mg2+ transporter-C (MgtC) family protein
MAIDPLMDIALRLSAATIVGGVIGLNRELKHQSAGLRTHALVALGAALATSLATWSPDIAAALHGDAMSRIIQGIITGIGFIGAGVILRTDDGRAVHGLTTAASIWLAACLGCACGAGAWAVTSVAFGWVLLILIFGEPLERWAIRKLEPRPDDRKPPLL